MYFLWSWPRQPGILFLFAHRHFRRTVFVASVQLLSYNNCIRRSVDLSDFFILMVNCSFPKGTYYFNLICCLFYNLIMENLERSSMGFSGRYSINAVPGMFVIRIRTSVNYRPAIPSIRLFACI
jgi:hypothetical protein